MKFPMFKKETEDKKCHDDPFRSVSFRRMNRSIQAEGTFGIIKNDRWYKRIVRRGIDSVRMEIFLVSIEHNLFKYHNIRMRLQKQHKLKYAFVYGEGDLYSFIKNKISYSKQEEP